MPRICLAENISKLNNSEFSPTQLPSYVLRRSIFCYCASGDGLEKVIQRYFCAVYDYAGKGELSKAHWIPIPRKLGVTTIHFSEIIKLQFGRKILHCHVLCFNEKYVVPWTFFFDSNSTCFDLFNPHSHKRCRIPLFVLEDTALNYSIPNIKKQNSPVLSPYFSYKGTVRSY